MKLEAFPDLFFVISVLVPGFIYNGVMMMFVPLRQNKEKELIILRFLVATAVNYALCSPLIYLLLSGIILAGSPLGQAACGFAMLFIAPILLAIFHAWVIQHDRLAWVYRALDLRPISPIPTGWDWIFGRTDPCFLLVTLIDGTEIAGFFGRKSIASSDPDHRDIFLEKVYTVPVDGSPWVATERTLGMQIDGAQIAFIEFRDLQ